MLVVALGEVRDQRCERRGRLELEAARIHVLRAELGRRRDTQEQGDHRERYRAEVRFHLMRLGVSDVERAAVCRDVDRAGAGDVEAEPLHVATLLDVLQLVRVVEGAKAAVLGPARGDGGWRRHWATRYSSR